MTLVRTEVIRYGVRSDAGMKATTAEVDLTHPVAGATTQEDANKIVDERITQLEELIDGGSLD